MVSLRRRFRSLVEFHVGSYIFYRKHIQKSPGSPMHIVVAAGLFARFLLSVTARALVELRNATIALAVKTGRVLRREPAGRRAAWRGLVLGSGSENGRRR